MATNPDTAPAAKVILGCSKSNAALPDGAQFCLKCGKPVSVPPKDPTATKDPEPQPVTRKIRRHYVPWILLALLLAAVVWAASSENPFARGLQELAGFKRDQSVVDNSFTVPPHSFRRYRFALPEGSAKVSIVGQFNAQADKTGSHATGEGEDNGIEVYVLSEQAFAAWQNGYATGSVYQSGNTSEGKVEAALPAGAGVYYVIFSNKSSGQTAKHVRASLSLRYRSWLGKYFRPKGQTSAHKAG